VVAMVVRQAPQTGIHVILPLLLLVVLLVVELVEVVLRLALVLGLVLVPVLALWKRWHQQQPPLCLPWLLLPGTPPYEFVRQALQRDSCLREAHH